MWYPGDGTTETCTGPGTPYVDGRTDPRTFPSCFHVYTTSSTARPGGAYAVTPVMVWQATWSCNVGAHGDFGPVLLTTTFPLVVHQLQAVLG